MCGRCYLQGSERQDFGLCLPVPEASDNVASPHAFQRAARAPRSPLAGARRVAALAADRRAAGRRAAARPPRRWTNRSSAGCRSTDRPRPTSAAVYWNPAALGLVRGFQLMVAGSGRLSTVNVNRAAIDAMASGMPGATTSFPPARARDLDLAVAPRDRTASSRSARTSAAIASRSRSRRTCRTCSGSPSRCRRPATSRRATRC